MNKIVQVDGIPIIHVANRRFVPTMRHGVSFIVESEPALRRMERAIDLLYDTGFDEMVKSTGLFTVVLNSPKGRYSALMGRSGTHVAFVDSGCSLRVTPRMYASCLVHEARHLEQRRGSFVGTPLDREADACLHQIDFLHCVGGSKEIEHIKSLFRNKEYWWIRSRKEEAAWDGWVAQNEPILHGLKELQVIS